MDSTALASVTGAAAPTIAAGLEAGAGWAARLGVVAVCAAAVCAVTGVTINESTAAATTREPEHEGCMYSPKSADRLI